MRKIIDTTLINPIDSIFIEFSETFIEIDTNYLNLLASKYENFIKEEKTILGNPCLVLKFEDSENIFHEIVNFKNKKIKILYSGPYKNLNQFEKLINQLKWVSVSNP